MSGTFKNLSFFRLVCFLTEFAFADDEKASIKQAEEHLASVVTSEHSYCVLVLYNRWMSFECDGQHLWQSYMVVKENIGSWGLYGTSGLGKILYDKGIYFRGCVLKYADHYQSCIFTRDPQPLR